MPPEQQAKGKTDDTDTDMRHDDIGNHRKGSEIQDAENRGEDEHHADIGGNEHQQDKGERPEKEYARKKPRPVDVIGHPREQDYARKISETVNPIRRRALYQGEAAGNRIGNKVDIDDTGGRKTAERKGRQQQQERSDRKSVV